MKDKKSTTYYKKRKGAYANPFFQNKRTPRRQKQSHNRMFGAVFGMLFFVGLVIVINELPAFRVDTIKVSGSLLVASDDIRFDVTELLGERKWLFLRRNHMLFLPKKDITHVLQDTYAFRTVEIDREHPRTIHITIGEREPRFRYYIPSKHFSVIDSEGVAVITEIGSERPVISDVATSTDDVLLDDQGDSVDADEFTGFDNNNINSTPTKHSVVECTFCDTMEHLIIIYSSSSPPVRFENGQQLLSFDDAQALDTSVRKLADLSLDVSEIRLQDDEPHTAEIKLSEGFLVYIDLSKDLTAQMANLSVVLEEKYPVAPRGIDYIDVRFGSRLYVCETKDAPCHAQVSGDDVRVDGVSTTTPE